MISRTDTEVFSDQQRGPVLVPGILIFIGVSNVASVVFSLMNA